MLRNCFFHLLACLSAVFPWTLIAQEPIVVGQPGAKDQPDHGSYLVGYNVGRDLAQNGFNPTDFVTAQFIKGLIDALSGKPASLTNPEIEAAGKGIQAKLTARADEALKGNLERSKAFLAENQKKDGVQTLKSGLQYIVLKKGQGKSPTLTNVVKVHYEGKLITGEVFDSTTERGPYENPVGQFIPGWSEALQRMAVGDKWRLFVPPDLAYGPNGPPGIGPNQALIFEIELLEIVR